MEIVNGVNPQLYSTRDRQKTYFDKDGKVKGRKFYKHGNPASGNVPVEVCPKNSILDFSIAFDNLTESELGLLLIAMGQGEPKIYPKLGGAKPVCYGSIEISVIEPKINNMRNIYLQYSPDTISLDLPKYLKKGNEIVQMKQLEKLVRILSRDNMKNCPDGNY